MDYLGVVLNGYFNDNHREHLEKYFFREYKKAEKEQFFDADEFFSGCQKVIQIWEKYLQNEVFKRQEELYNMLDGAKNKTINFSKIKGKTIEQQRQETIEYCEKELQNVRPDGIGSISFTVHLMSLTSGRIAYNLPYNEVLYIKDAIENAFQKAKNENEPKQPEQKKDKIYSLLSNFWDKDVITSHYYKSFKSQIDTNGCFQIKTDSGIIKIYKPELAVILTSTGVAAIDTDTQKETVLNGREYLKTYIEAYHLGEQYFDTEIKVSPNILYGANAEQYVRDIHLNYFHTEHRAGQEGWVFVKRNVQFAINKKLIYDYGYYSGIINKVDEQVKKYPKLFEAFDNCEHKLPPQQNAKQKPELSKIWLSEPQVTVSEFLIMGIEKGIWNEQYNIITARGSLYGTGKSLLGSLFIALKGYAISNNIDYKEAGKAFCSFFNIPINEKVKEPYKAFSSGTEKQIKQLKRAFNIK
jgi:hypothetical protein